MAKRFIDTTIWTQNKWFRKLKPEYKVLWFYLISSCDSVGVWEEDIELCSFIIGYEYTIDRLLIEYDYRLKKISDKKYWIIDFCNFQYGPLKEENIKNKPHQSYITLLKKHSLWIEYKNTIDSVKEKDKDKEEEQDKDKDNIGENVIKIAFIKNVREEAGNIDISEKDLNEFIEHWTQYDFESKKFGWQVPETFLIKSRLKGWNKKAKNSGGENWEQELEKLKF